MDKLKILIVDDSPVYRKILSAAAEDTGIAIVEDTALNGLDALEKLKGKKFEVVLLDVNMPDMDGIETLKRIKSKWSHISVIMISGGSGKDASSTLKALEFGAMDFILKPLNADYAANKETMSRYFKALFLQIQKREESMGLKNNQQEVQPQKIEVKTNRARSGNNISGVDLLLVASSTGGPMALEKIFEGFGKNFFKPILMVQHMPVGFTKVLAESLDKKSELRFIEGSEDVAIRAGQAIVAPGGMHMVVHSESKASRKVQLTSTEQVNGVRPAADVLFKSVATEYGGARVLVVVLTGMGADGAEGVKELKKHCNCYCITQSEETCIVYGMPRSVVEAGLSDETLDLKDIAARIQEITEHGS